MAVFLSISSGLIWDLDLIEGIKTNLVYLHLVVLSLGIWDLDLIEGIKTL